MRRRLVPTPRFVRDAKRLRKRQPQISAVIEQTLLLMERDAFDQALHTHKLKGHLASRWACTVAYDCRIIFGFEEEGGEPVIVLLAVGTHDELY